MLFICAFVCPYISESSVRGVLVAAGSFSTTIGPLIVFFLGTLIEWRAVALIFCVIQIVTLIALLLVSVCFWNSAWKNFT